MKRTFITFSDGQNNDELTKRLRSSIQEFSNYELIVYNKSDFQVEFDSTQPDFWKSGFGYIYKVLSCLKSLDTYDEVVWMDNDCLATNYIDKIWFETWRIDNYPLLPKYRFSMFGNNLSHIETPIDLQVNFVLLQQKEIQTSRKFYSQACFMVFTKKCKEFYEEVLSYFDSYDKDKFPYKIFPHGSFGDESIINYLFWKYNYTDNLGEVFLCSHFFHKQLSKFIENRNRENFGESLSISPVINNFENILFLHGQKNIEICDFLLSNLIEFRKN